MVGIRIACFENTVARDLFRELFQDSSSDSRLYFYTMDEFISELVGTPSTEGRLGVLTELLPETERPKAGAWLYTLEKLRESLILGHEDADFCFSVLPKTPRHKTLLQVLHAYLDSPLKDDWTERVWHLRDLLREKQLAFEETTEVTFVQSSPSNFLFPQLAGFLREALPMGKVMIVPTWKFKDDVSANESSPTFLQATTTEHATALAKNVAEKISSGVSPSQILIPTQASRTSVAFLQAQLARFGVSFQSWIPEGPSLQQTPPGKTWDRLREVRASSLDLDTRLAWGKTLLQLQNKDVSPDAKEKLLEEWGLQHPLPEAVAPKAKVKAEGVHLIPITLLPPAEQRHFEVFVDETVFQPDREPLLLRENDLFSLEREGFSLPKLLDHKKHIKQLFTWLAEAKSPHVIRSSFPEPQKLVITTWGHCEQSEAIQPPETINSTSGNNDRGIILPQRRPLSATQLETFAKCPSQYLFSQILRWRKQEAAQDQYALIFGQATHAALEKYFCTPESRDQILHAPEDAKATLLKLFQEALENGENPVPLTSSASIMWQEHFRRFCAKLPAIERQLADVFGSRRVLAVEKQFTIQRSGSEIIGKIDRIDEREDGSLLVLDYKTGTIDFTPDHIGKGNHFQALLYVLGAEKEFAKPVSGMLFYDLKQGEVKRGILREESFAKECKKAVTRGHLLPQVKWESIIGEGHSHLERLAGEISAGNFTPAPSAKNCQYCDFATGCRKAVGYA